MPSLTHVSTPATERGVLTVCSARRPAVQPSSGPAGLGLAAPWRLRRSCGSGGGRGTSTALQLVRAAEPLADFVLVPWDVSNETWDEESETRMKLLTDRFLAADKDGDGVIDKAELRDLLERVGDGDDEMPMHWLTDDDISDVMRQYDANRDGVISFGEFVRMSQDNIFLSGKVEEYRTAFSAVDQGSNGTISASELYRLFNRLGHPLSYEKLVQIMEGYDLDQSGVIDFPEFMRMFRNELLDLKEIMEYIKQVTTTAAEAKAAAAALAEKAAATPAVAAPKLVSGAVTLLFSEEEFDAVLASSPGKVVVLMASLTWCKPCKAFQDKYAKAAQHYTDAIFLKFYGNSNEGTKVMFKDRLKCRTTPSFFFFLNGRIVQSCSGAIAIRLETHLRQAYGGPVEQEPLWPTEADLATPPAGAA